MGLKALEMTPDKAEMAADARPSTWSKGVWRRADSENRVPRPKISPPTGCIKVEADYETRVTGCYFWARGFPAAEAEQIPIFRKTKLQNPGSGI